MTPALYSSSAFCMRSWTCISMAERSPVRIGWMSRRPIASRIALSATARTVPSGFSRLNT